MAVYTETIKLEDNVSAAAAKAQTEVKVLTGALDSVNKSLIKASALGDIEGFKTLTKQSDALKAALSVLPPAAEAPKKAMKDVGKSTFDAANAMAVGKETISAAFAGIGNAAKSLAQGDVKGAVQGLTDSVAGMAKMLDLVVPGLGQAVAAVVQIAGGLVAISAGLIKSGIEFAISSNESKQAMLGLFDAMGGGLVTGAQTEEMIDGLKSKFGIAKDSLIGYTSSLMAMGRTDLGQLEGDLLALSSAAALVKGGDQALLGFVKKIDMAVESGGKLKIATKQLATLSATGANVGDVAKVMGVSVESLTKGLAEGTVDAAKFGEALNTAIVKKGQGPLERMGASSANLKKLLDEAWGDLFEDIDVAPFMKEVKELFEIFGQGKSSGAALKSGIGGFFKEVLATATKVVPMVKHFLLDLVIYGLKAYIALKPIVKTLSDFATSATGSKILLTIVKGLAVAFAAVAVVIGVVVAAGLIFVGTLIAFQVALVATVGAIMLFIAEAESALLGWIASAYTMASDFVSGLVEGITAGAGAVLSAVTGLADGAVGAFTSALGIASPSKVMFGMAGHMTDGVVEGLDDGASDVAAASSGVASASVKGMSDGASSGANASQGGGSGAPVSIMIQIDGAGKSALEITEEMVAAAWQRLALGAGV